MADTLDNPLPSQLLVDRFVAGFRLSPPQAEDDDVRVCVESRAAA